MTNTLTPKVTQLAVSIPIRGVNLAGDLAVPPNAKGLVIFAHGSGSSRHSPRNQRVAELLNADGFATLLLDLLTAAEDSVDEFTGEFRFDLALLSPRLLAATRFAATHPLTQGMRIGYFGASTGAGAALVAAALDPSAVHAVVSRGGRPDLASGFLAKVRAPTLLIVGAYDTTVIAMNRDALDRLVCAKDLVIVERASHLFEEPGALDEVAQLAQRWFERYLAPRVDGELADDVPDIC
jgi:dienelactone hydrolase